MSTILNPEITAQTLHAIEAIMLSNNGHANIGNNSAVADAVSMAGFTVIHTTDLHGNPTYKGFTQAAQAALRVESFGISTYKPIVSRDDGIDYEAAILDRQERAMMDY